MKISFFVEKQSITRTDREVPATSSLRYLKAEFSFGKDWDTSHNICPYFRLGNSDIAYVPALVNEKYLDADGTCFVPIELLQNEGRFFVSVVDETNGIRITTSEAYVTVRKGSSGLLSPTIHALNLMFKNESTLLQLTANGAPIGEGVHIDRETRATLLFDKLAGVQADGKIVFEVPKISGNISASTSTAGVYLGGRILHSLNHTDGTTLTVMPVLSGMPTILYSSDASGTIQNRYFPEYETVSAAIGASVDGKVEFIDEEMWKELCAESGGVGSVSVNIDPAFSSATYLVWNFNATFTGDNAVNTTAEFKAALDEILPMLDRMQIRTNKHITAEMESEVIYNA